jgi:hypothetical protein
MNRVVALVDGAEVAPVPGERELAVPLPTQTGGELTLEVSLPYTRRPPVGEMALQMPELRDATPARRWFWQLLVPRDEHLLVSDTRLTSANQWQFRAGAWRLEGSQTQRMLEEWTAGSQQLEPPPGLNQYLFSSFDRADRFQVRTCSRWSLVYLGSALVLLVGSALIYVPRLWHPVALLVLGVLVVSGAMLFPTAAILLAQSSILGAVLIVVGRVLAAILRQIRLRRTSISGLGRTAETRSGVLLPRREGPAAPSTATAAIPAVPAVVPDSKV